MQPLLIQVLKSSEQPEDEELLEEEDEELEAPLLEEEARTQEPKSGSQLPEIISQPGTPDTQQVCLLSGQEKIKLLQGQRTGLIPVPEQKATQPEEEELEEEEVETGMQIASSCMHEPNELQPAMPLLQHGGSSGGHTNSNPLQQVAVLFMQKGKQPEEELEDELEVEVELDPPEEELEEDEEQPVH